MHDVDLSPGRSQRPIHVRKLRVKIDYKRRRRQNKPCFEYGERSDSDSCESEDFTVHFSDYELDDSDEEGSCS